MIENVFKRQIAEEISKAVDSQNESNSVSNDGLCLWRDRDGDKQIWKTGCNDVWVLAFETPEDSGMSFCPICGKKVKEA